MNIHELPTFITLKVVEVRETDIFQENKNSFKNVFFLGLTTHSCVLWNSLAQECTQQTHLPHPLARTDRKTEMINRSVMLRNP